MAALMLLCSVVVSAKKKQSIVILYENDVHCAIEGYQVLAGLRDAVADTAYVAVVSSGDFVQGGTAGAISRGQYVADIMRTVGYDAITLGNHEFDFPVKHTKELLAHIGAPVVCTNLYETETNRKVFAPYIIKKFGKTKIAFIGAATPGTFYTETGAFFEGDKQIYDLREKDFNEVMQRTVDQARKEGARYVVVLSHLGEDPDRSGVNSHEMIKHTTGIDIVLDGHTHSVVAHDTLLNAAGKPVVITETGSKFENIGKLVIRKGKMHNELLPVKDLAVRSERVQATTDSVLLLMQEQTRRIVCHSDVSLQFENAKGTWILRTEDTNTGNLICDAFRVTTGADIALANGGCVRRGQTAGDWTYGDIAAMLPYDNHLWVVEASGATIVELLRRSTQLLPEEDGSFPQVSGLRYTAHVADHSISDVEVLNRKTGAYEPIDLNRNYTVSTIDYCVSGGGFYDALKNCKVVERGDMLYRDVFVEFVEKNLGGHIGQDYSEPQGRIRIEN